MKLNLRLKALKRQMDEAEEEIDRLEHGKKKLQRELDEQQEANEQLQNQLKGLQKEIRWVTKTREESRMKDRLCQSSNVVSVRPRRKSTSAPLLNTLHDDEDDDDISTDGETYFSSSSAYKRSSSQENILSTFTLWSEEWNGCPHSSSPSVHAVLLFPSSQLISALQFRPFHTNKCIYCLFW